MRYIFAYRHSVKLLNGIYVTQRPMSHGLLTMLCMETWAETVKRKTPGRKKVAVRDDMALQQYYRRHAHKEPNKAIIKVAHKLLSRIRAVIINGIPYQAGLLK